MSETRDAVVASWRAARREAETHGVVRLNHASAAGWVLESADGNADEALEIANRERLRWGWWGAVVGLLARVVVEEREGQVGAERRVQT